MGPSLRNKVAKPCVSRVCGGGCGCAGGVVPLGAVPVLSWCGEVSLGGKESSSSMCSRDRLLTEDDDAAADTYDSDADCCRLRR